MAITQARMIALIAAGRDFEKALAWLRRDATQMARDTSMGQLGPATALAVLLERVLNADAYMDRPYDSRLVLEMEHNHFKKSARRNAKEATRAREALGKVTPLAPPELPLSVAQEYFTPKKGGGARALQDAWAKAGEQGRQEAPKAIASSSPAPFIALAEPEFPSEISGHLFNPGKDP